MNKFLICDICKGTDFENLQRELKKLDSNCQIVVGCHNLCGVGRNKPFVIFDNKPIIASSVAEVIEMLKEII